MTTVKLTGNFLATARCLIFADGGGISWAFNPNTNVLTGSATAGGTFLSSVGFADTSTSPIFTVTNSPLIANGTLDITLKTQASNTLFAGPTTGSAAQPSFRAIVAADLPAGTTPVGANPSASVGLAASNGSAVTFLRSDGAPALSQAITPTWSALHTFGAGLTVSAGAVTLNTHTLTLSANATVGGTNTGDQVVPVGANPSATIGLAAVNGTAATWMTSDSAPALSQGISPTWTGNHTFTPAAGTAVTINGKANSNAFVINATTTSNQSFGLVIVAGTSGSDYAIRALTAAGSEMFKLDGARNIVYTGSGAGTAVLNLNTMATTGAKTAAMTATNKPGTNNQTTPAVWVPIVCDGTTYYLPAYAA